MLFEDNSVILFSILIKVLSAATAANLFCLYCCHQYHHRHHHHHRHLNKQKNKIRIQIPHAFFCFFLVKTACIYHCDYIDLLFCKRRWWWIIDQRKNHCYFNLSSYRSYTNSYFFFFICPSSNVQNTETTQHVDRIYQHHQSVFDLKHLYNKKKQKVPADFWTLSFSFFFEQQEKSLYGELMSRGHPYIHTNTHIGVTSLSFSIFLCVNIFSPVWI